MPANPQFVAFNCHCGQAFQANPGMAGSQMQCQNCQQVLVVPAPAPGQYANEQEDAQQRKRSKRQAREAQAHMIAVVSYLTLFGLFLAFILYLMQKKKHKLSGLHLRQAVALNIVGTVLSALSILLIGFFASFGAIGLLVFCVLLGIPQFCMFIAWVYGLFCAIIKSDQRTFFVGEMADDALYFIRD